MEAAVNQVSTQPVKVVFPIARRSCGGFAGYRNETDLGARCWVAICTHNQSQNLQKRIQHHHQSTMAKRKRGDGKGRKDKNGKGGGGGGPLERAYRGCSYKERPDTGEPGTPHRYFTASFDVRIEQDTTDGPNKVKEGDNDKVDMDSTGLVVHQHANGLCVVCCNTAVYDSPVKAVTILVNEAPACSYAERRKKASKLVKQGVRANQQTNNNENETVTPRTAVAKIELENGKVIVVPAGVYGFVLEINDNYNPSRQSSVDSTESNFNSNGNNGDQATDNTTGKPVALRIKPSLLDPLLEGYLMIVQPAGPFPLPKENGAAETPPAVSENV